MAFTLSVPKDFFCYDSYISTEVGGYALDDMTVASAKSDNAVKHYKFCCGMFDENKIEIYDSIDISFSK